MKLKFLLIAFVLCAINAVAQKNLSKIFVGENGMSKAHIQLSKDQQFAFKKQNLEVLLSNNTESKLILKSASTDALGFAHYRFKQAYRGYEIQHASLIAHARNGVVESIGGEMVVNFGFSNRYDTRVSISEASALQNALSHINATQYAWQDEAMEQALKNQMKKSTATYKPKATLVWYNKGDEIIPSELRLAYRINIYARIPLSRAEYFIDAKTGELLGKVDKLCFSDAIGTAQTAWSGPQTIHSDYVSASNNYRLRDLSKGAQIITLHGENGKRGQEYNSTTPNWSFTNSDLASLDAHYGAAQTWQFYYDNFNRNSYDNNGTALVSYINDPTYIDNAFWDGQSMNYNIRTGSNGGVTGIDVCGHELTHGVTQETSNLVYSSQSGGINESLSDIMGKSVQFWSKPSDKSWLLSNDMNWLIRNMANPNEFSMPDTYQGQYWSKYANVHSLSGVGNFMFVLLVDGGTGTNDKGWNYNVAALGLSKADQIIYRSNDVYLSANSKYPDWRVACINAATDLYGASSNEVLQVKNAFYAVGIDSISAITCTKPAGLGADSITTKTAVLSWNAVANAKSYNVQWEKTGDQSWVTVSDITSNSYKLTGLSSNTSYEFRVQTVCDTNSSSVYSASSSFVTAGVGGYCNSKGLNSTYEYIQSVKIGSFTNESGDDGGYGNYSKYTAPIQSGNNYSIHLKAGFSGSPYSEYFSVFIDYNHDRDFLDAGEKVGTISTASTNEVTINFTVPATAKNGITGARVKMVYGTPSFDACGDFSYGEVEDYTVNISGASFIATNKNPSAESMQSNIASGNNNLLALNPNPVINSNAYAIYKIAEKGNVQFEITSPTGVVLKRFDAGLKQPGNYSFNITGMDKLHAGTYFILLKQNSTLISSTQFLKQ